MSKLKSFLCCMILASAMLNGCSSNTGRKQPSMYALRGAVNIDALRNSTITELTYNERDQFFSICLIPRSGLKANDILRALRLDLPKYREIKHSQQFFWYEFLRTHDGLNVTYSLALVDAPASGHWFSAPFANSGSGTPVVIVLIGATKPD